MSAAALLRGPQGTFVRRHEGFQAWDAAGHYAVAELELGADDGVGAHKGGVEGESLKV